MQGASVPQPFGGKYRQIMIYVDPLKLEAHQLSPMDVVRAVFPSPVDRPAIKGYKTTKRDQPVERAPSPDGSLVAQVFRTHYDPFAGMLTYARVWSGKIVASADVYNSTRSTSDRPTRST